MYFNNEMAPGSQYSTQNAPKFSGAPEQRQYGFKTPARKGRGGEWGYGGQTMEDGEEREGEAGGEHSVPFPPFAPGSSYMHESIKKLPKGVPRHGHALGVSIISY